MDIKYEILLDIQKQQYYTCRNCNKCNVLENNVECRYVPSIEADRMFKGTEAFWGRK